MPRPPSWLARLHEIRRSVGNSVRSHYDRRDLEQLFELQSRAAQKLLEMLPSIQVGTSRLIERETLSRFLNRVHETEDVTGLIEQLRQEKVQVSRKKIRSLVRAEIAPASISSLPDGMILTRGRLEVNFQSVERLAEAMYALARVLETDGEGFAAAYEPVKPPSDPREDAELQRMLEELRVLQCAKSSTPGMY